MNENNNNNNVKNANNDVQTQNNNQNQDNRSLQLENNERNENPNGVTSADYPNGDHQEETAAEFAPTRGFGSFGVNEDEETAAEFAPIRGFVGERPFADDVDEETADGHAAEGRGVGAFAIVLSIISLFFLPVILGAAGIIVGFIARRNKATALGNSAIGIGAISIILTLFFSPFF